MSFRLLDHSHGKSRVRVMRVDQQSERQDVSELDVKITLRGDAFGIAFDRADNSTTVATDTMKNLAYVVAAEVGSGPAFAYLEALAAKFLTLYEDIETVSIEASETVWQRAVINGSPHTHAFTEDANGQPYTKLVRSRDGTNETVGGIDEWRILKSTGSGFADFLRDGFTSLPETDDRILASAVNARWHYRGEPVDLVADRVQILETFLRIFADTYSVSVQDTMYRMATAVLDEVSSIDRVSLSMPNLHYLPTSLERFGVEDSSFVFIPAADPHGLIEATVSR
ncbi:MAG: factor-independent urate hydroxylase [Pseudomonadota bacterium]